MMDSDIRRNTPFASVLQTNCVLSDDEQAQVRSFLAVNRFSEELAEIISKKEAYEKFIRDHRALLSPIRRLPVELLRHVFRFCLPARCHPTMSPFDAPLTLTRVCRKWREVALAGPELWSSLYLPIPPYPSMPPPLLPDTPGNLDKSLLERLADANKASHRQGVELWKRRMGQRKRMLAMWFERAAKRPIALNILEEGSSSYDCDRPANESAEQGEVTPSRALEKFAAETRDILLLLQQYATQWCRLELKASYPFIVTLLSCFSPNLTSLRINNSSNDFVDLTDFGIGSTLADTRGVMVEHVTQFPRLFPLSEGIRAPNLKTWFIKSLHEDIFQIPVIWGNITEIFFEGYSDDFGMNDQPLSFGPKEALSLLRTCPKIQKCHLVLRPRTDPEVLMAEETAEPQVALHLDALNHLSIHEATTRRLPSMNKLFSCLIAPSLQILVFTTKVPNQPNVPSPVLPLLATSGSHLRTLAIDYRCWRMEDLREAMKLVNDSLEELWLNVDYSATKRDFFRRRRFRAEIGALPGAPTQLTNDFLKSFFIPRFDDLDANGHMGTADGASGLGGKSKFPKLRFFYCNLMGPEFDEETLLQFIRARRHRGVLKAGIIENYIETVVVAFAAEQPLVGLDERLSLFAEAHKMVIDEKDPVFSHEDENEDDRDALDNMLTKRNRGVFSPLLVDPALDLGTGPIIFTRPHKRYSFYQDTENDPAEARYRDKGRLKLDVTWPADYVSTSLPRVFSWKWDDNECGRPGKRAIVHYEKWSPDWRIQDAFEGGFRSACKSDTGVVLF